MDFRTTTLRELHEKLVSGEVTPGDLLDHSKSVIEDRNPTVNAFIEVFDGQDTNIDPKKGTLAGIPMAVKDNILFKGKKVSGASKMLENYVASYDAKVAELLAKEGALLMGRTNMDEFAMGTSTESSYYGVTRNPLDETRVPGGSSGGPAAAVAAGMVAYTLGSDTGGSIRQPAACCGVVGLKPSYGSVSRRGLFAMSSSLDVIGPITNSVEDAELVFNAINEYDELDNTSVLPEVRVRYQEKNTNGKVIGVPRAFLRLEGIHPEVLANFESSIKKMEDLGYTIVDIDLPTIEHALAVYYIIQPAEASSNLARYDGIRYGLSVPGDDLLDGYLKTKTEGFGREVQRRIMLGTYVLSSGYHDEYYYKARALRAKITEEVHQAFDQVDIIATPTAPNTAFKLGEKQDPLSLYLEDLFTVPANLTGNPAISIPSGKDENGMPFGMHFTAPMFCENKLFEISKDFERAILN
ncbi:Asp-tRNA(Asn)/Glu-tRNA(Gln) amidotransferase subunit GatA [Patescibacteria group bacterium]|nr:Asp-tRNA(Asn)/Glu-tRNA(Gln) amidotransferase subunit GatA [Patescibacteria group bacterium]